MEMHPACTKINRFIFRRKKPTSSLPNKASTFRIFSILGAQSIRSSMSSINTIGTSAAHSNSSNVSTNHLEKTKMADPSSLASDETLTEKPTNYPLYATICTNKHSTILDWLDYWAI